MGLQKSKKNHHVYRITVDEKLSENLLRLLLASLKQGVKTFNDDSEYWNEEKEILVEPKNYQTIMGVTRVKAKKWSWDRLCEGQVFLSGEFKIDNDPTTLAMFDVNPGRKNFRHINFEIKDNSKEKYLKVLQGGTQDGKRYQIG
ncbi:hypothetical protein ACFL60_01015 [Candidatus Omnitrophota bacterium]